MKGIPLLDFAKMPKEQTDAMRRNYAETLSVPLDRVAWREKRCRYSANGRAMFLFLKRHGLDNGA